MSDQVQSTPTRSGLKTGLQLGVIAIAAALAVACGGGGVGSNSTGSAGGFTSGTVTGFGSIIVNGARYDDSSASVTGDDDSSEPRSNVMLGMEVEIEHSGDYICPADTAQLCKASATSISYGSSLSGPVFANNALLQAGLVTGGEITVLGQTVVLTDATIFVGFTTAFDQNYRGQVEVHGTFDNVTGKITASRVAFTTGLQAYRLRGTVSAIDTNAKTAVIGRQTVVFSSSTPSADSRLLADFGTLTVGSVVRVKLSTNQNQDGSWNALKLKNKKREHANGEHNELEGTIGTVDTTAKTFTLNGVTVDYSSASYDGTGNPGDVAAGKRVEVKGDYVNGSLVATKVEFKGAVDRQNGNLEFHVTVPVGFTAPLTTTFTLTTASGVDITFDASAVANSLPNLLVVGNKLEIKAILASDGTTAVIKKISLDSAASSSVDDKKKKSS